MQQWGKKEMIIDIKLWAWEIILKSQIHLNNVHLDTILKVNTTEWIDVQSQN